MTATCCATCAGKGYIRTTRTEDRPGPNPSYRTPCPDCMTEGVCRPAEGIHTTPHKGCILR